MRKMVLFIIVLCSFLRADVVEKKNIFVSFPKFGEYTNESVLYLKGNVKADFSNSDLKGKGFWGKLIGNFFPKGKSSVITNLDEETVVNVNYSDSSFTKSKIQKYFEDNDMIGEDVEDTETDEQEESEERNYRVLRNELKVIDTGENRKFQQFEGKYYQIIYIFEKEMLDTKIIYTDSLFVNVYTTDNEDLFAKANSEKKEFQIKYLALLGTEVQNDDEYEELLGMNWLTMLSSMNMQAGGDQSSDQEQIDFSELKKIKGYPFYTDGSYFNQKFDPNAQPKETKKKKKKSGGFGGFGGMMDKVQKSMEEKVAGDEEKEGYQEVLSYKYETTELLLESIDDSQVAIPKGFKDKSPK